MTTLKRATIRSYNPATHRASVQAAGSLPTLLTAVPVATDIPAAEVVAGRECAVLLFDDNPDNAVVVTVHGAVPAATSSTSIVDADGDTKVEVEASADEDKVRTTTASTLRSLISNTSPHHDLTGDVRISGILQVSSAASPPTDKLAEIGGGNSDNNKIGLHVGLGP